MKPSMLDWLPPGHMAFFVLDVVDKADTSAFHARHPNDGVGRPAYDPVLNHGYEPFREGLLSAENIEMKKYLSNT